MVFCGIFTVEVFSNWPKRPLKKNKNSNFTKKIKSINPASYNFFKHSLLRRKSVANGFQCEQPSHEAYLGGWPMSDARHLYSNYWRFLSEDFPHIERFLFRIRTR